MRWSLCFTAQEIEEVRAGLGWDALSNESVLDYERKHAPPGAWPPTSWFLSWASGQDAFDLGGEGAPIELRWLAYEKVATAQKQ